jgi:HKD family nuclease
MPQVSVINQPFGGYPNRLGDHIAELLSHTPKFDSAYLAVAFAKASGVGILFDYFRDFVNGGSTLEVAVGVDERGTSRQGLDLLLQTGATVYVFHNYGGDTFHPKLYLFHRVGAEGVAIVGSNNLTRGGLYDNFEFSVRLSHNLSDPSDLQTFQLFLDSFRTIADVSSGMAIRLSRGSLSQLDADGYLLDESRRATRIPAAGQTTATGANPLFRHVPMPHGPRASRRSRITMPPIQPGTAVAVFVMTLGTRDTRQRAGYSRDIFIPIAGRNANRRFWSWPSAYTAPVTSARGSFLERRVDLQVTPVTGITRLVRRVRIYYYAQRDEFRMNCSELVAGATPGDILVLSRVQSGAGYDYDAAVIPQSHPMHGAFLNFCTNTIPRSSKRWGYV